MWDFIWQQYKKYQQSINYLIFGFLTFVVNTIVYQLCAYAIGAENDQPLLTSIATMVAWAVAVLFAYWTNRSFVFRSQISDKNGRRKEFISFVGARVATGIIDQIIMIYMTYYLDQNDLFAKIVGNIFVIISNYFLSKLFIFKKKAQP